VRKSAANTNDAIMPAAEMQPLTFTEIEAAKESLGSELLAFIRGLLERAGDGTKLDTAKADEH
jgi:hypothetical protein